MNDTDRLVDEKKQAFRTLNALLQRRDEVYDETGEDPLDNIGHIIKAAGMVRDQLDPEEVPRSADIDPADVFDMDNE